MESSTGENWVFEPLAFDRMRWYAESEAPVGVPIIDFGELDPSRPTREQNLASLRDAITGSGFFYLKNHGISEALLERFSNVTRAFFGAPAPAKEPFALKTALRGYSAYRLESTALAFGTSRGKDLCMKYTMGPELTEDEIRERVSCQHDIDSKVYAPNVFPSAQFRADWLEMYKASHALSIDLLGALKQALGLNPEYSALWTRMLQERMCAELRYYQYPDVPRAACSDIEGNIGDRMAPHVDLDVITLLHQTPCENGFVSLEAKIGSEFVGIPAIRGTFVVNLGEIVRLMTGNRVKATIHRVMRPPERLHAGSARDVIALFQVPPLNSALRPILFDDDAGGQRFFDEIAQLTEEDGTVTYAKYRSHMLKILISSLTNPEKCAEQEVDAHYFQAHG